MFVKKIAIENVRSFLDRTELILDGLITIVIGPNGGGKTNLLDTLNIILRRYLFASRYAFHAPKPDRQDWYEFRDNDALNNMILEKHSEGANRGQVVELEIEVTKRDIDNMHAIAQDAPRIKDLSESKYGNIDIHYMNALRWNFDEISAGQRIVYRVINGVLERKSTSNADDYFLQYLQMFEMDAKLREVFDLSSLVTPLVYLHVNRSASGFQSNVELAGYNDSETKRHSDAVSSRSTTSIVKLAVGRLAQKYRILLEKDKGNAKKEFLEDKNNRELTKLLGELGYGWSLETINPLKNQYDIRLEKQGSFFLVGNASSGERELLIYLFAIFALNVRDALIIVDEPELHLHPKWQKKLLQLFIRLSQSTGNQFLLATHSPTFVSPESIQYISRVFSYEQRSHIRRLNAMTLPEAKHLLNIINSQNNERLFFADEVVLVEGLSDRICFEAVLDKNGRLNLSFTLEVIDVGGKNFFEAYKKVLDACEIKYSIVADLDYVEEIGSSEIKKLFEIDETEIKKDVLESQKSLDGKALVEAIDKAIETKNWTHAEEIWNYIKSRRIKIRKPISKKDKDTLNQFIKEKYQESIYILSKGALEEYLPEGWRSKDLNKLITFLNQIDFWEQIPQVERGELELIAKKLLQVEKKDLTSE